MNDIEAIRTGLVVASTIGLAKAAKNFFAAICGQPDKTLSTAFGTWTKRRIDNVSTIGGKAHFILLDLGQKPGEIKLNVAQPALEAASLEEDPEMQDRWANLLANAADPRQLHPVTAAFPRILQDLGPREVKFLDCLYETYQKGKPFSRRSRLYREQQLLAMYCGAGLSQHGNLHTMTIGQLEKDREAIDRDMDAWNFTLAVLCKHGLLQYTQEAPPFTWDPTRVPRGQASARAVKFDVKLVHSFSFTQLGVSFVEACRRPAK
jgi:abortive infection alpha-like protein